MFGSMWGSNPFSDNRWSVGNVGVKYKKNPIYELSNIKLVNMDDLPEKIVKNSSYSKVVDPDFVGKLAIIYEKDNIGKSGGHPQWCYVYDCDHGKLTYRGTAIHKCVDLDSMEQNYNEKLFSIYGKMVFDTNRVRIPDIDLIKNVGYEENKPAVLSYNVTQREETSDQPLEEMEIMKTVVFNKLERKDIKDNRTRLDIILDTVRIEVMKKVGYEKKYAKENIADEILGKKMAIVQGDKELKKYEEQIELLNCISNEIDNIDSNTTFEVFLEKLSKGFGRKITNKEISEIKIKGSSIGEIVDKIKNIAIEREKNYKDLEKDIIQITTFDVMTNNIDRHLTNWALLRNKKTGHHVIGIFDHAASFFNMGLKNGNIAISDDYLRENWASSSVILDSPQDKKIVSSKGIEVFRYLMNNYREYTLEILKKMYDKLPEFKKQISFDTIPNAEYDKLSEEEKKKYYNSEISIPVSPKKVENGLKSKFSRIEKEYQISFKDEKERADRI